MNSKNQVGFADVYHRYVEAEVNIIAGNSENESNPIEGELKLAQEDFILALTEGIAGITAIGISRLRLQIN